ncbi:hypothetical protein CAEBREN_18629 [Caenorhabditis brenneri]|uniref:Nuclear receptor domain-containing protein n=1 Tax=Caenorhabditis brenneri TaxID=135651 RepID=G0NI77_CAEBE|nr:hypothetical protein CAEBREN_18629 [Caenorhabditis brenneri]
MPRAYDFRQKKAINYNEKLPNRTKSNPSSARKTRGRKSEGSSIVSNSTGLRRKKAVDYSYEEDEDDSPESSQSTGRLRSEPVALNFSENSTPNPNLTDQFPVLGDMSPPILTRECNNYSEVHGELSNRTKSNPSSARKTRGRKPKASPIVSNSRSLRRRKAVNKTYEEDEDDSPESSQAPILGLPKPIVLDSTGNPSLTDPRPVLEDLSPPILTREVNNNMEEKNIDSRGSSPPPQLERMPSVDSDSPISNGSGARPVFEVRPVLTLDELLEQRAKSAEKVLTEATPSPKPSPIMLEPTENPPNSRECEICGNPASKFHYGVHTCESCSVEFFSTFSENPGNIYHVEDLASPNLSPIMLEPSENPSNSSQCQVCGNQANGSHFGVETCESCSTFFQQKVTELPDYNCYCNRVWKHAFDINVSCHCCRFQKCLDVGMQIPPDSMFSRITPHSENLGLCRVCGDIGTSHCKGVVTCSSCTFFLFRSTQKPFDGECDKMCLISSSTRNCPACRFNKFHETESQIPKNGLEEPEQLGMKFFNFRGKQKRKNVVVPQPKPKSSSKKSAPTRQSPEAADEPSTSDQAGANGSSTPGPTAKKCPVCGGEATRKMNGMPKFYIRRVKSNTIPQLVCEGGDENCVITLKNRSCNSCRFKKCIEVGMSGNRRNQPTRDASEEPEDSEVEQPEDSEVEHAEPVAPPAPEVIELDDSEEAEDSDASSEDGEDVEVSSTDESSHSSDDDVEILEPGVYPEDTARVIDPNKMVFMILDLYVEKCPYTAEKLQAIERREFGWQFKPSRSLESNRISCWVAFSALINTELVRLLGFVPKLQTTIDIQYLKTLFFKHVFTLLHLWWARGFTEEGLVFADGRFIKKCHLKLMYGDQVYAEMLDVATEIRRMRFTDHDFAMLIGFVFLQPSELNHPYFDQVSAEDFNQLRNAFFKYGIAHPVHVEEALELVPRINALRHLYKQEVEPYLQQSQTFFPNKTLFFDMFVLEGEPAPIPEVA